MNNEVLTINFRPNISLSFDQMMSRPAIQSTIGWRQGLRMRPTKISEQVCIDNPAALTESHEIIGNTDQRSADNWYLHVCEEEAKRKTSI